MSSPVDAAVNAKRRDRLRAELGDEQVPVLGAEALPDALAPHWKLVETVILEELIYARHVPVHEGLRPTYGCLIVENVDSVQESTLSSLEQGQDLATVRPFVDGSQTMLVRDIAGRAVVAQLDVSDELTLVQTAVRLNAISVQRLSDARIRIRTQPHVVLNDGFEWTVRPLARNVIPHLSTTLALPPAGRLELLAKLRGLLEFCFHRLSPRGIGATLIVMLTDTTDLLDETCVSDQGEAPALPINVFDETDHPLLLTMLESVDGACQIETDGTLSRYKSKLQTPAAVGAIIAEHGGTRHTSAKRFSYCRRQALVIVVSADGPVTLFSDGVPVVTLDGDAQARVDYLTEYPLDARDKVEEHSLQQTCERCDRTTRHEYVTDPAVDASAILTCAVCGTKMTTVERVVHTNARVIKPWETN